MQEPFPGGMATLGLDQDQYGLLRCTVMEGNQNFSTVPLVHMFHRTAVTMLMLELSVQVHIRSWYLHI